MKQRPLSVALSLTMQVVVVGAEAPDERWHWKHMQLLYISNRGTWYPAQVEAWSCAGPEAEVSTSAYCEGLLVDLLGRGLLRGPHNRWIQKTSETWRIKCESKQQVRFFRRKGRGSIVNLNIRSSTSHAFFPMPVTQSAFCHH